MDTELANKVMEAQNTLKAKASQAAALRAQVNSDLLANEDDDALLVDSQSKHPTCLPPSCILRCSIKTYFTTSFQRDLKPERLC